jgi:hypothetical protein
MTRRAIANEIRADVVILKRQDPGGSDPRSGAPPTTDARDGGRATAEDAGFHVPDVDRAHPSPLTVANTKPAGSIRRGRRQTTGKIEHALAPAGRSQEPAEDPRVACVGEPFVIEREPPR